MAAGVGNQFICRWRLEGAPHFEARIAYNDAQTKIVASLINTNTNTVLSSKILSVAAVFDRCVWRADDLPANAPLESRLFRSHNNRRATWVGIDLDTPELHVIPYTVFDDELLKSHALAFNSETRTAAFQQTPNARTEAFDSQAEKGMVRPSGAGEEEIVHIWDHVGDNGVNDLRLVRKKTSPAQETLILRLFYRATGTSGLVALSNQSPALVNPQLPIEDRVVNFAQHPTAILGGRSGNTYSSVTLSASQDVPVQYQGFFQGRNLQAVPPQEIAQYIQETLFVVRNAQTEQVVGAVEHRTRVEVKRLENYNFGGEYGALDAIHMNITESAKRRWGLLPFHMVAAFFSGMLNSDAPRIHQLKGLDKVGMQDLLLENPALGTPLSDARKVEIFQEFDRAILAGADIDFYIAVNRKVARLHVNGLALQIRSAATTLGRIITFRYFWSTPGEQAAASQSLDGAQAVMTAAAVLYPPAAPALGTANAVITGLRAAGGVASSRAAPNVAASERENKT